MRNNMFRMFTHRRRFAHRERVIMRAFFTINLKGYIFLCC